MSILCEDVLENLRNATPCFIVVAHSGLVWASTRCSVLFLHKRSFRAARQLSAMLGFNRKMPRRSLTPLLGASVRMWYSCFTSYYFLHLTRTHRNHKQRCSEDRPENNEDGYS